MRVKRLLAGIVVTAAIFGAAQSAQAFTDARMIIGIDIGDSNQLILRLSGDPICSGNTIVTVNKSQPYYTDMYAMALSAYASNKPIRVYVEGCVGNYAKIARMMQGNIW